MAEVIELSNATADRSFAPADFVSSFPAKTLQRGDLLYMRSACIDGVVQDPSTQISLPADVPLAITVAFYEYDLPWDPTALGVRRYVVSEPYRAGTPSFLQYLLMRPEAPGPLAAPGTHPVTRTLRFTVPRGVYTPDSLAQTITRALVAIDESTAHTFDGGQPGFGRCPLCPCIIEPDISGPLSIYDDQMFTQATFVRMDLDATTGLPDGSLLAADRYYYRIGTINPDPAFDAGAYMTVGARQLSLTYNANGSNRFEWTYLHSPLEQVAVPAAQPLVVEFFQGAEPSDVPGRFYVGAETGCFLVDLEPRDWWTALGFNLGIGPDGEPTGLGCLIKFVPPDAAGNPPYLANYDRDRHQTWNLFTTDDMFVTGSRVRTFTATQAIHNSSETHGIAAAQFYAPTSPFFLISLEANWDASAYQDGRDSSSRSISAIVTKAYVQGSWVLGYSDGAIVYRHDSDVPLVISNVRVRILDAETKELAVLGPRNFVHLQIDRAAPADGGPPPRPRGAGDLPRGRPAAAAASHGETATA